MVTRNEGGEWSVSLLRSLIGALTGVRVGDAGARSLFVAEWLQRAGVPYAKEHFGGHGRPDHVLDFSSFDCATFVYAVNALAGAWALDSYMTTLYAVRYAGPPSADALIHYALNVLRRFEELGVLEEASLSEPHLLGKRAVLLDDRGGGNWFIPYEKIGDSNRGRPVRFSYTPTASWTRAMLGVRSGDTIVFVSSKPPHDYPGIVGHLGIAYRTPEGEMTMYHCSKMLVGAKVGPCAGVSVLRHWDESAQALRGDGRLGRCSNTLAAIPTCSAVPPSFGPSTIRIRATRPRANSGRVPGMSSVGTESGDHQRRIVGRGDDVSTRSDPTSRHVAIARSCSAQGLVPPLSRQSSN